MIKAQTAVRPILVVGGSGFIGGALVRTLVAMGHRVRGLSRRPAPALEALPGVTWHHGALLDDTVLSVALEGVDICFHLASSTVPRNSNDVPLEDIHTNLMGTVSLLTHAVRTGVKRVIFVSSGGTVYGTPQILPIPETHPLGPISSYGIVKAAIEHYLGLFTRRVGLEHVILRMSNPYGPGQRPEGAQGVIAVFLHRILNGQPVEIWGDGSAIRDFVYIDDAVSGLIAAMDYRGDERIFNIGAGQGYSLHEIVTLIEKATGRSAQVTYKAAGPLDVRRNVLSIDRARAEIGYTCQVSLIEGLYRTAAYFGRERRAGNLNRGIPFSGEQ